MKAKFYLVEEISNRSLLYESIRENNLYSLCFVETGVGEFVLDLGCNMKNNIVKSDKCRPVRINKCKVYEFSCKKFIIEDEFGNIFQNISSSSSISIKTYSSYKIESNLKDLTKTNYGWIASIKNLVRKFLDKEFKQ